MNTDKIINIFKNLSDANLMNQDKASNAEYISSRYLFSHENFVLKFVKSFDYSLSETILKVDVLDFDHKEIFSLKLGLASSETSPLVSIHIENKHIKDPEEQKRIIVNSPIYDVLDILYLKTDKIIQQLNDEKNELAEKLSQEQQKLVQKTLDRMQSLRQSNIVIEPNKTSIRK